MKNKMNQLFQDERKVHVLYAFNGLDNYLNQLLDYIDDGISVGDRVLVIENERVVPMVKKLMVEKYTKEQMELVHFVNSLHFYWSSGSYHPPAIHAYFIKTVQPYIDNGQAFRSWAHVEWESVKEPLYLIEDFEKIVDNAVAEYSFPLICAYEKKRMPDHLQKILMETHPYILLEDDFIVSDQYLPMKT